MISPYDAELYGHWWYEGPIFLDHLIRKAARDQDVLRLKSPVDYLSEHPEQQLAQPPMSSWGAGGYAAVWLDEGNDWIYRYLHKASERMIELARMHHDASGVTRRALNQAARELLLAQSSDWAFIIKTGTMVDYAVRRTRETGTVELPESDDLRSLAVALEIERMIRDGQGEIAWPQDLPWSARSV